MTVYLTDYKTFKTKIELNEAVDGHLTYQDLNKTERDVLIMLSQYSVKYYGVSHLKAKTIANHIGKSERTVRRATKKLEQLGIICKLKTFRKITGGKGANIMQILPFNKEDFLNDMSELSCCKEQFEVVSEPIVTTSKASSVENEPITTKANNLSNTDDTATDKLKENLLKNIPSAISDTLAVFFDDAKEIYEIYGTILKAKSAAPFDSIKIEDHAEEYELTLINVIRKYKQGTVRNLNAYLYKAMRTLSKSLSMRSMALQVFG